MNPSSILIVKLKLLGDTLTTTPMIPAIKAHWPNVHIDFLVNPDSADILRYHPGIREVLTVPRSGGILSQLALFRELRRRKYDIAIELSDGDRGATLTFISGAPIRIGYRPELKGKLNRGLAFNRYMEPMGPNQHTVDSHFDALRILGLSPEFHPMELFWPPDAGNKVRQVLSASGMGPDASYVVVHPVSHWMFKAWHPEGNAAVIDYLAQKVDRVIVTGGTLPEETDFLEKIRKLAKSEPLILAGKLNLPELAALIAGAVLYFGVDTLPMHIAAAVGTPIVALFGPSDDKNWSPWSSRYRLVMKNWECQPCRLKGCNHSGTSKCLQEITPDEVLPVVDEMLTAHGKDQCPLYDGGEELSRVG